MEALYRIIVAGSFTSGKNTQYKGTLNRRWCCHHMPFSKDDLPFLSLTGDLKQFGVLALTRVGVVMNVDTACKSIYCNNIENRRISMLLHCIIC